MLLRFLKVKWQASRQESAQSRKRDHTHWDVYPEEPVTLSTKSGEEPTTGPLRSSELAHLDNPGWQYEPGWTGEGKWNYSKRSGGDIRPERRSKG